MNSSGVFKLIIFQGLFPTLKSYNNVYDDSKKFSWSLYCARHSVRCLGYNLIHRDPKGI